MKKRKSGILLAISSLPSKYSIGAIGNEAYKFLDYLKENNQSYWQILPIGPTGYGDSPYASFSSLAGNHYYIDIELLLNEGLLSKEEISRHLDRSKKINYDFLFKNRLKLLKTAYSRLNNIKLEKIEIYLNDNKWVADYSLFMTLKYFYDNKAWYDWPVEFSSRDPKSIKAFKEKYHNDILFWAFTQYYFYKQWNILINKAKKLNIKIIGDMPFYPAYDSCDIWINKESFSINKGNNAILISGCPPDYFSKDGQLWGNPVFMWDIMEKNSFKWWMERFEHANKYYDSVRIDHFLGLSRFWAVEKEETTAKNGIWIKSKGDKLLNVVNEKYPNLKIIAEDLGVYNKDNQILRRKYSIPGMAVITFGFDENINNNHLPHNYKNDIVAYTSTHDNMTLKQWIKSIDKKTKKYAFNYTKSFSNNNFRKKCIELLLSSDAYLTIFSIQDILNKGKKSRMNIPGTTNNNWVWRLGFKYNKNKNIKFLKKLTKTYRRK